MRIENKQLKDFLMDSGLVAEKDILEAEKKIKKGKDSLGKILVGNGVLSEDDLRRSEAYILGIPFIGLKGQKIDFDVLSLIPEPIARKHNIVAFKKGVGNLEVAMLDTEDLAAIDFIKKKVGLKIFPRLTDDESMKSVLLQYQKSLKAEFGDIIQKEAVSLKTVSEDEDDGASEKDLKELAEDIPVIKIVDTLLNHAILQSASDIHIEPMETQLVIRYRIDGILHDAMVLPKSTSSGITARIKVLAGLKLDEKRLPQDGRFKIEAEDQRVSFRVSILPTYYGEKTVMRLLRDAVAGFTLEFLGYHGEALERVHRATKQKTGMILITGPTGSGKTTSLYTILDILNTPDVNISTVEDPIEYQVPRINQTQVRSGIGLTFAAGLRSLVRQDPDIIMVGEIRDGETAKIAVNAALTGHLVLSTLHTNSAAGAMPRLIDMDVEPFLIVSTVKVIIAQRLVRKLGKDKQKYILKEADLKTLQDNVDMDRVLAMLKEEKVVEPSATWKDIPFYRPKNLKDSSGYKGRMGIYEVLEVSSTIKELIIGGATPDEISARAIEEGMYVMIEDGIFKAARGETSIEEVLRVISE
ncbi:MAG: Flp pilus assembly complex ATPase component TadA [Candidatus Pacebacteria bacterium]|nr:Flp pilus assembly complex ATPase component TadA [Candidatus Paceibacterota bacterium]